MELLATKVVPEVKKHIASTGHAIGKN